MQEFIVRHGNKNAATLWGFDRLVFRGTLRSIGYPAGMQNYLHANEVLLKDFAPQGKKGGQLTPCEGTAR